MINVTDELAVSHFQSGIKPAADYIINKYQKRLLKFAKNRREEEKINAALVISLVTYNSENNLSFKSYLRKNVRKALK